MIKNKLFFYFFYLLIYSKIKEIAFLGIYKVMYCCYIIRYNIYLTKCCIVVILLEVTFG